MRLTVQTDYALRLLMHLAVQDPELTSISASADRYKISKNHLMKVAHNLKNFGYVEPVSCLLYTSPSPRDKRQSRMPSSA